jgi:hypothetical protein
MHGGKGKEKTLRNAGLIEGPDLPSEFSSFIEELSEEEVEVLVNLKRRLDKAGIPTTTLRVCMPVL